MRSTEENKQPEAVKTLGEIIDEKSQEYIKLFMTLTDDEVLKDRAESLALSDLIQNKFIAEQVFKRVESAIKRYNKNGGLSNDK